ncbi:MAG: hypothetical protein JWQ87_357 [Candidatus Sulfotelmatobacter sp.]|nr:hypothetical protein [Candidatus Sulfotelmatobacter sp.]
MAGGLPLRSSPPSFPQRVPHPCVFCKGGRRCGLCYLVYYACARGMVNPLSRRHPRFPPFAKSAKNGASTVLVVPTRAKVWATRRPAVSLSNPPVPSARLDSPTQSAKLVRRSKVDLPISRKPERHRRESTREYLGVASLTAVQRPLLRLRFPLSRRSAWLCGWNRQSRTVPRPAR